MTISKKTLVIDDDEAFGQVLCRALLRRGHEAQRASNATEALSLAETHSPVRIVLDLNLAGWRGSENGLSLIAPLQQICPEARIVLLTGYASIATAVDAIKLGAAHYLAKPVDVDTLLGTFEAAEAGEPAAAQAASQPPPGEPLSVGRLEWEHIQRVLNEHEGNISATARALKMHRRTLQRKLGKYPVKD